VAEDRTLHIQQEEWGPEIVLVHLGGDLDLSTVTRLAELVEDRIPGRDIIVDLSGLQYIDSTAIATLAQLHNRAVRLGRRFILAQPSLFVQRILDLTSLRHAVIVYPEVAVALDALREQSAMREAFRRLEPATVGDFAREMAAVVRASREWVRLAEAPAVLDAFVDALVERLTARADRSGATYVTEEQFYDMLFGDVEAEAGEDMAQRHAVAAVRSLFTNVIAPQLAQGLADRNHPQVSVTKHRWIRAGHWDVAVVPRGARSAP
jgi:anti-sigma B factor antagonist